MHLTNNIAEARAKRWTKVWCLSGHSFSWFVSADPGALTRFNRAITLWKYRCFTGYKLIHAQCILYAFYPTEHGAPVKQSQKWQSQITGIQLAAQFIGNDRELDRRNRRTTGNDVNRSHPLIMHGIGINLCFRTPLVISGRETVDFSWASSV